MGAFIAGQSRTYGRDGPRQPDAPKRHEEQDQEQVPYTTHGVVEPVPYASEAALLAVSNRHLHCMTLVILDAD